MKSFNKRLTRMSFNKSDNKINRMSKSLLENKINRMLIKKGKSLHCINTNLLEKLISLIINLPWLLNSRKAFVLVGTNSLPLSKEKIQNI